MVKKSKLLQRFVKEHLKKAKDRIRKQYKKEYINNYNQMVAAGEKAVPWADYIRTKEYAKQIADRQEADARFQLLKSPDVLSDKGLKNEYDRFCQSKRDKQAHQAKVEQKRNEIKNFIRSTFIEGEGGVIFLEKAKVKATLGFYDLICNKEIVRYNCNDGLSFPYRSKNTGIRDFCENYSEYIKGYLINSGVPDLSLREICQYYLMNRKFYKENKELIRKQKCVNIMYSFLVSHVNDFINVIKTKYPLDDVIRILNTRNPVYKGKLDKYLDYEKNREIIKQGLLQQIPENYIDLFPLARQLHRKFTLHIGGTNSGKTYSAMQALKACGSGIYLAPLRLLAFEQYDKLNSQGYGCSLVTGEERKEIPNAPFQASTIEMLDLTKHYDMIVVDEAQMISDNFRGGSWTNAIFGGLSEEIHICAAPEAEEILIKSIKACGDEYEIVRHERETPLIFEDDRFDFERDIQKGDALIVFSKRSVHAVSNDLKAMGIKSSIIYGALPYDVRQNEANKFANGLTDVVVTTDAIGMGMNLPIRRVVFLETTKFDGKTSRPLLPQEIKQIAGRAGRFGIFDEGYVTSYTDRKEIRKGLEANISDIKDVFLKFSRNLIGIEGPLSSILSQWEEMKVHDGFQKADVAHERRLCEIAEKYTDNKELIYDFITIPFEDDNEVLFDIWENMVKARVNDEHLSIREICTDDEEEIQHMALQDLEALYKVYDLIYYYNDKFEQSVESSRAMEIKQKISERIIKLLDEQNLPKKNCRRCGKPLAWNFKYNLCEECYNHRSYRDYFDW